VFTVHIPLWAHTYDFVVLASLTHPRNILFLVLEIGKAKDLSAPVRTNCSFKFVTRSHAETWPWNYQRMCGLEILSLTNKKPLTFLLMNVVFWDVVLCRSCVNRRFGGTYRFHLQGRTIRKRETSVRMWLQSAYLPFNLKTEIYIFPETLCSLGFTEYRTMAKLRKSSNSECYVTNHWAFKSKGWRPERVAPLT
jgi:hypothetical protein